MAAITQLDTSIPVVAASGWDYGAEAVQDALKSRGYYAVVVPQVSAHRLKVTLKKSGGGTFDDEKAKNDIVNAAGAFGTHLAAFKEWVVQTAAAGKEVAGDLSPSGVGETAADYWKDKKEQADKEGWFKALGIPGWVPWAVGGIAGLYVLNSLVSAKKAFIGGTPSLGAGRRGPPSCSSVHVDTWEERDRLHIHATTANGQKTVAEWWDDDARQMFEDGFFRRQPRLKESVLDYLESMGQCRRT